MAFRFAATPFVHDGGFGKYDEVTRGEVAMSPQITEPEIDYPDCDGMPMADNTLQWEWIATIKGNLDLLFANDSRVRGRG